MFGGLLVTFRSIPRWLVAMLLVAASGSVAQVFAEGQAIRFNEQIRPIFNEHCVSCHGGVKQASDVSFIYRSQVLDSGIIELGDPENSELIARITSDDPDLRMPPADKHSDPLPAAKVALLEQWIREGALWDDHWAFIPPRERPPRETKSKEVTNRAGIKRPLDRFVFARLDSEGLAPSPPAEPTEWIRRVSLDLTGLPPKLEELDRFIQEIRADKSQLDSIYRRAVERLLASPHFGERWAAMWLDLARYADTKGYEADRYRDMWPYRDWLIHALNDDIPFDQFTIRQLAGDLLPDPTLDDMLATTFHRNTQTNTEGGTDDEEFRVAAVIDRINTTWTVWQGITFGCVQCHSHPYDPFEHQEFYSFMAFFNNSADLDLDSEFPTLKYLKKGSAEEKESAYQLQRKRMQLRRQLNQEGREVAMKITSWQPLAPTSAESSQGQLQITEGHRVSVAGGTVPIGAVYTINTPARPLRSIRLDIYPESDDPATWPEAGSVLSQIELQLISPDGKSLPLKSQLLKIDEIFVDYLAGPYDPMDSLRKNPNGLGDYPKLLGPRWAVFVLAEPLEPPTDSTLVFKLTQSASSASGNQSVHLRQFEFSTSNAPELASLTAAESHQQRWKEYKELTKEVDQLKGVDLPVMRSRGSLGARSTWTFVRGNWLAHGEEVSPGVPGLLHRIQESGLPRQSPNRLDLAKWLVSEDNPLTARVLANRLWAELFGTGLVETLENFGSTGAPPSHPALLDHLALCLQQEHQWHIKPFLRDLVLSATYRQTHRATAQQRERDPKNRLLARGPRTRLSAEMVRDQALAASGRLSRKLGGPPVMPPQPPNVWQSVYNESEWVTSKGTDRYRRAVYTFWKRTSPYPSLMTFDAPSREVCSSQRIPTNTPLQALVTLNDPAFVELSQALAARAQDATDGDAPGDSVRWAYRALTQHEPSDTTLAELISLYQDCLAELQGNADEQPKQDPAIENAALKNAALAIVANTLLNLDEALTK